MAQDNDDFSKTEELYGFRDNVRVTVEILVAHAMFITRLCKVLGGKALKDHHSAEELDMEWSAGNHTVQEWQE